MLKKFSDPQLSDPSIIFDINYYRINPFPVYGIIQHVFSKNYAPSLPHKFIKYLQDQQMLYLNYTQNIDGLELDAGISPEKMVFAHGSMKKCVCLYCQEKYDL